MRAKQLDYIKSLHNRHMKRMELPKPCREALMRAAIVSGIPMKLKSSDEILKLSRHTISESSGYGEKKVDSTMLFKDCASYRNAMNEYERKDADFKRRVGRYLRESAPLIRGAELDDENKIDSEELAKKLDAVAVKCGLQYEHEEGEYVPF